MTKVVRVFAVLIMILGVASTALGVANLSVIESSVEIMRSMRLGGYPALPGVDLDTFRWGMYGIAAAFIITGVLAVIGGVGTVLMRNWGRIVLLVTFALMIVGTIWGLAMNFVNEAAPESVLTNCLLLIVYSAVFYFFYRRNTKQLFMRNSYVA